jgi:hypothetical protein
LAAGTIFNGFFIRSLGKIMITKRV